MAKMGIHSVETSVPAGNQIRRTKMHSTHPHNNTHTRSRIGAQHENGGVQRIREWKIRLAR